MEGEEKTNVFGGKLPQTRFPGSSMQKQKMSILGSHAVRPIHLEWSDYFPIVAQERQSGRRG